MKHITTLLVLAAATFLGGCVAYPVDGRHDGYHRSEYRDGRHDYRDGYRYDREHDHYHNGQTD
jgi:hypothetical protein